MTYHPDMPTESERIALLEEEVASLKTEIERIKNVKFFFTKKGSNFFGEMTLQFMLEAQESNGGVSNEMKDK